MPAVELDQAMRADFEAWSVSAGFAYRNHQGFWFYRNGGDGMFEAYCAGAVSQRKGLEDNPCHCQKPPNVEFSGVPVGHSINHPAGGTSAGTQGYAPGGEE